jgi:hypothetical protein
MLYQEVLTRIRELDFDEVGRFKTESLEMASIASSTDPPIIPFAFPNYQIILENGDDSDIDDEIVDSLMRWIVHQAKPR